MKTLKPTLETLGRTYQYYTERPLNVFGEVLPQYVPALNTLVNTIITLYNNYDVPLPNHITLDPDSYPVSYSNIYPDGSYFVVIDPTWLTRQNAKHVASHEVGHAMVEHVDRGLFDSLVDQWLLDTNQVYETEEYSHNVAETMINKLGLSDHYEYLAEAFYWFTEGELDGDSLEYYLIDSILH